MTIARRGLKVKVMSQANAVGPTSVEGSFFLVVQCVASGRVSVLIWRCCDLRYVTYTSDFVDDVMMMMMM